MPSVTGPNPNAVANGQDASQSTADRPRSLLERFLVLKGAVPELWISLGIKMLAFFAYTVMNQTLTLWLSSDLGYNDARAGGLVAAWSATMTFVTVLVGSFADAI